MVRCRSHANAKAVGMARGEPSRPSFISWDANVTDQASSGTVHDQSEKIVSQEVHSQQC